MPLDQSLQQRLLLALLLTQAHQKVVELRLGLLRSLRSLRVLLLHDPRELRGTLPSPLFPRRRHRPHVVVHPGGVQLGRELRDGRTSSPFLSRDDVGGGCFLSLLDSPGHLGYGPRATFLPRRRQVSLGGRRRG